MENKPFFTILTINYNNLNGLKKTIESIEIQNFNNFEYLIVDGNSSDGSIELIKNRKIISQYIIEKDKGIFDALNKGSKLAKGEYVLALNSGDQLVDKDTLKNVYNAIKKNGKFEVYFGNTIYTLNDKKYDWKYPYYNNLDFKKWLKDYYPVHQTVFIKKHLFDIYNYDIDYLMTGDNKLFSQLKEICEFKYLNVDICYFELEGVGTSSLSLKKNLLKSFELSATKIIYEGQNKKIVKVVIFQLFGGILKYFTRKIFKRDLFYKLMKYNQKKRIKKYLK